MTKIPLTGKEGKCKKKKKRRERNFIYWIKKKIEMNIFVKEKTRRFSRKKEGKGKVEMKEERWREDEKRVYGKKRSKERKSCIEIS